ENGLNCVGVRCRHDVGRRLPRDVHGLFAGAKRVVDEDLGTERSRGALSISRPGRHNSGSYKAHGLPPSDGRGTRDALFITHPHLAPRPSSLASRPSPLAPRPSPLVITDWSPGNY